MRKVLGHAWLKSLPALRYESVQTAFVPKRHADAGLFLLLQAAELSREWRREIVVVQLDVKKAFDHADHRAAFKAMRLQGVSPFSMALIAAIWNGSCMKARLGKVLSSKIRMSREVASRGAGISGHLHSDHGTGTTRFAQKLDNSETGMETGRLRAVCDLLCGRCGVGCCVGCCCGRDGGRGGWSVCWCTENTLDKSPEDDKQKHCCGRTGCVV